MSYLWKSKTWPLIVASTNQEQTCKKKAAALMRHKPRGFFGHGLANSTSTSLLRTLWHVTRKRKTFYPKQVSLKPLVPFSCKMEAEVSFILMWHPKCWFSTWSFPNIFCSRQFAVSQNVSQYIASNSKCKLLKFRQLNVLERQTVFIF